MPDRHPQPAGIAVAHLTTTHTADDARVFTKECLSLARGGYDVSLVIPDNRFVTADGRPVRRQDVDIVALARKDGLVKRLRSTMPALVLRALRLKAGVYHIHDPELIPGGLLLRLLGKRVIYDVHEDLPRDILTRTWLPPALRPGIAAVAEAVEWIAGRAMSGVVAATPTIARRFPRHKTVLVQNFALFGEFADGSGDGPAIPFAERGGVAFAGSICADRCAVEMIDAVERVTGTPQARLLLAGPIESAGLRERMQARPGWARVDYRGQTDRAGVQRLLAESRVGLALYYPTQNYLDTQPVKLFEYMAAGIPVITADFPYHRGIVEGHGCGLCVPPTDLDAVATAIQWVFDHPGEAEAMGRRGREAVLAHYNWVNEERELMRLYNRIAPTPAQTCLPAELVCGETKSRS
ncbi:glycosyltransferase family protein [Azospirillum doebereinerae]|uniref:glycosyltransferase family protein n=1 Tax=Azospirillum doebereinerae TaxID=92933 RepID=UPI001B3BECEE|nr:glycosyltransferase [Azospirillum doebereinerae]